MSCNIGDTYGRAEELLAFLLLRENLTKVRLIMRRFEIIQNGLIFRATWQKH